MDACVYMCVRGGAAACVRAYGMWVCCVSVPVHTLRGTNQPDVNARVRKYFSFDRLHQILLPVRRLRVGYLTGVCVCVCV